MNKQPFPSFWYESNTVWGKVDSIEDLYLIFNHQKNKSGFIGSVNDFLDRSKADNNIPATFGTRREHNLDFTLRMYLDENGVLEDFLNEANKE